LLCPGSQHRNKQTVPTSGGKLLADDLGSEGRKASQLLQRLSADHGSLQLIPQFNKSRISSFCWI
jgi:hypothetical protein